MVKSSMTSIIIMGIFVQHPTITQVTTKGVYKAKQNSDMMETMIQHEENENECIWVQSIIRNTIYIYIYIYIPPN